MIAGQYRKWKPPVSQYPSIGLSFSVLFSKTVDIGSIPIRKAYIKTISSDL